MKGLMMENFCAKLEIDKIVEFIRSYYKDNNLKGVVIGLSGGKDSAVLAALFTKALGSKNVIGVSMPCYSKKKDRADAKIISDYYGFELYNFSLTKIFDLFRSQIYDSFNVDNDITKDGDINLKPRLRMATLYYLAAMFSAVYDGTYIVAGTSNKCELYVGYFTKGGDSVLDISVLSDFTVDEVIKMGEFLKVPSRILYKKPNDGISNLNDEDKLGVKYKDITNYIKGRRVSLEKANRIVKLHEANIHKICKAIYRR